MDNQIWSVPLKSWTGNKENTELKKMYAEAMLGIKVLQETIEKKL